MQEATRLIELQFCAVHLESCPLVWAMASVEVETVDGIDRPLAFRLVDVAEKDPRRGTLSRRPLLGAAVEREPRLIWDAIEQHFEAEAEAIVEGWNYEFQPPRDWGDRDQDNYERRIYGD